MRLKQLVKACQWIFKENREQLDDIIVFGSMMKGKEKAADIDILVLFKEKINKQVEGELRKRLEEGADVNSLTKAEFESEGFIAKEGIFLEGYSLVHDRSISGSMGFASVAFIKYDLKNIIGSKRIRFYYALHGRGGKGFLKEIGGHRFSENVIVCDYAVVEKTKPFFETWDMEYSVIPALIPARLRHILLGGK